MATLTVETNVTGLAGVTPQIIYIGTTDTVATVTTPGYLNKTKAEGFNYSPLQMALVSTRNAGVDSVNFYRVTVANSIYTLVAI